MLSLSPATTCNNNIVKQACQLNKRTDIRWTDFLRCLGLSPSESACTYYKHQYNNHHCNARTNANNKNQTGML